MLKSIPECCKHCHSLFEVKQQTSPQFMFWSCGHLRVKGTVSCYAHYTSKQYM